MLRTIGMFKIENVLPFRTESKIRKTFIVDDKPYSVWMNSQRYHVFAKSSVCACCGLKGEYFLLQANPETEDGLQSSGHFNLYGVDPEIGEVLMTKDHIIPKSKGGKDSLKNYRTLCMVCNSIRSNREISFKELLKERIAYTSRLKNSDAVKQKEKARKRRHFKYMANSAV